MQLYELNAFVVFSSSCQKMFSINVNRYRILLVESECGSHCRHSLILRLYIEFHEEDDKKSCGFTTRRLKIWHPLDLLMEGERRIHNLGFSHQELFNKLNDTDEGNSC